MSGEPPTAAVLVVEDRPEERAALVAAVRDAFPSAEVDEAADLGAAFTRVSERAYRLALVDLGLPDGSGVELIRRLAETRPETLAIVTTIFDDDEHLFAALAAGAGGYVLKDAEPQALARHLRQLDAGVPALSPSIARRMLDWFRKHPPPPAAPPAPATEEPALSPRETEVLSLIGRGLRVGEVAGVLGLTEQTIASYVKVVYRKLNVSSRAEAALEAARRGLT